MARLNRKQRLNLLKSAVTILTDFNNKYVSNFAASTAFFFFISLIPICILLSMLLPMTGMSVREFEELVLKNTPAIVDGLIRIIIEDAFASGGVVFSFSLLTLVYTAGKGMIALMQGLNVIYGIRERRPYPQIAAVAVIHTTLLLVFILVTVVLGVFGENIYRFIAAHFPELEQQTARILGFRGIVIFGLAIILFSFIYTFVPAVNRRFSHQLAGAIFSTAAWMAFSKIFSFVMGHGSIYSTYYGSLATIVIFMMWMYGGFYILLIGGYINVVCEKTLEASAKKRKK